MTFLGVRGLLHTFPPQPRPRAHKKLREKNAERKSWTPPRLPPPISNSRVAPSAAGYWLILMSAHKGELALIPRGTPLSRNAPDAAGSTSEAEGPDMAATGVRSVRRHSR